MPKTQSPRLPDLRNQIDLAERLGWDFSAAGCALRAVADLTRTGDSVASEKTICGVRSGDLAALLEIIGESIIATEKKLAAALSAVRACQ